WLHQFERDRQLVPGREQPRHIEGANLLGRRDAPQRLAVELNLASGCGGINDEAEPVGRRDTRRLAEAAEEAGRGGGGPLACGGEQGLPRRWHLDPLRLATAGKVELPGAAKTDGMHSVGRLSETA